MHVFDPEDFGNLVKAKMERDRLSTRDVEKQTRVSHGTINRVTRGFAPDVENFLRLSKWLGWRWTPPRDPVEVNRQNVRELVRNLSQ